MREHRSTGMELFALVAPRLFIVWGFGIAAPATWNHSVVGIALGVLMVAWGFVGIQHYEKGEQRG